MQASPETPSADITLYLCSLCDMHYFADRFYARDLAAKEHRICRYHRDKLTLVEHGVYATHYGGQVLGCFEHDCAICESK